MFDLPTWTEPGCGSIESIEEGNCAACKPGGRAAPFWCDTPGYPAVFSASDWMDRFFDESDFEDLHTVQPTRSNDLPLKGFRPLKRSALRKATAVRKCLIWQLYLISRQNIRCYPHANRSKTAVGPRWPDRHALFQILGRFIAPRGKTVPGSTAFGGRFRPFADLYGAIFSH